VADRGEEPAQDGHPEHGAQNEEAESPPHDGLEEEGIERRRVVGGENEGAGGRKPSPDHRLPECEAGGVKDEPLKQAFYETGEKSGTNGRSFKRMAKTCH